MDATRLSDGKLVYLKEVKSASSELKILSHLSSDELRKDPRNHTIPLLETLPHPTNPALVFMVMPFLRFIDQPPFETVEDAYECGEQILEVRDFDGIIYSQALDICSSGFGVHARASYCSPVCAPSYYCLAILPC